VRREARERLAARGRAVAPELVRVLREDRLGGVALGQVLELLGELGEQDTLPAVLAALDDPRALVRSAAMRALAAFPGPDATDALLALLREPDRDVVKHAAALLGVRGDPAAVPSLVALLGDEEAGVRYSAAGALRTIDGPDARTALARHLERESDADVRALIGPGVCE
jgi:HEAT repeat protein